MPNIPINNTISIVEIIANDTVSGIKRRPVYVVKTNGIMIQCYAVTTKFANKSKHIQDAYFEIADWQYANLNNQSWIDTNTLYNVSVEKVTTRYVGILSARDSVKFAEFLEMRNGS